MTSITRKQVRIANRVYSLYAEEIRAGLQAVQPHLKIEFDAVRALNVAVSAYDDIARYKLYHLEKGQRSDVVKRAAYFAKWTARLRPLVVTRRSAVAPDAIPRDDLGLIADEVLALSVAMRFVSADIGRRVRLKLEARSAFLYDLRYREVSGDALVATFQTIVDLAKAGKENPIVEVAL